MPFTVSHIAAVLPAYRPLSRAHMFTAAVIGSMVPDFGFLLRDWPTRLETHSFTALFTFCLPVGLVTYLITLLLVKPAVMAVVPDGAWRRLQASDAGARPLSAPSLLLAALALLGGAVTHLVW